MNLGYLRRPDVRCAPARLLARRIAFELARRIAPRSLVRERVVRLAGGARMLVRLDDLIEQTIYLFGVHEVAAARVFRALVRPATTVVDVGAHSGQFTLMAAAAGARVHAFEPQDAIRARLERNLQLNGFTSVAVHGLALCDRDGEATLSIPTWEGANSGMATLRPDETATRATVRCARLDSLDVGEVQVMKIDVEGLEAAVIRGARSTIERHRPAILFEVNDCAPGDPSAASPTVRELRELGYGLYGLPVTGRSVHVVPLGDADDPWRFREPWQALNLLALHPATSWDVSELALCRG